jgi:hypothetical protein
LGDGDGAFGVEDVFLHAQGGDPEDFFLHRGYFGSESTRTAEESANMESFTASFELWRCGIWQY